MCTTQTIKKQTYYRKSKDEVKNIIKTQEVLPTPQFGFHYSSDSKNNRRHQQQLQCNNSCSRCLSRDGDRVWHDGLLYKMSELNLLHWIINTIKSYLEYRTFRITIKDIKSTERPFTVRVPQESMLSSLLYNIRSRYDVNNRI